VVIEIADEGSNRALKVDVIFPKGIVGIDEQGLARSIGRHTNYGIESALPVIRNNPVNPMLNSPCF
jgi:hypothetical protein